MIVELFSFKKMRLSDFQVYQLFSGSKKGAEILSQLIFNSTTKYTQKKSKFPL